MEKEIERIKEQMWLMKDRRGVIQPRHNGQIAVDYKEQIIVAADVSQNATDHAGFKPIVEQVERNLGNLPEVGSADAGYSSYDNLEFAEGKGLDLYMPDSFLEALGEADAHSLGGGVLQGMPGKGAMYKGRDTDGKSRWA